MIKYTKYIINLFIHPLYMVMAGWVDYEGTAGAAIEAGIVHATRLR